MKKFTALFLAFLLALLPVLSFAGIESSDTAAVTEVAGDAMDTSDNEVAAPETADDTVPVDNNPVEETEPADNNPVEETAASGITRMETTFIADAEGCAAAFEENSEKWVELLNKLCLLTYIDMANRNVYTVSRVGSAAAFEATGRVIGDDVFVRTNWLKRVATMKKADVMKLALTGSLTDSGSTIDQLAEFFTYDNLMALLESFSSADFSMPGSPLKEGTDLMQLVKDVMGVSFSFSNTISAMSDMMNSISISNRDGWRVISLDLPRENVSRLINALADDMLASGGLGDVAVKYFDITDFTQWVNDFRTEGLRLADDLLVDNLKVSYRSKHFGSGQGVDAEATMKIDGKTMHIKVSGTKTSVLTEASIAVENLETQEGFSFSFHADSDAPIFTAEYNTTTVENGILKASRVLYLSMGSNAAQLIVNDEELFSLTWDLDSDGLHIKGKVNKEDIDLTLSFSLTDRTFTYTQRIGEDTLAITGNFPEDGQFTASVSLNGNHIGDIRTVVTENCTDPIDWDALLGATTPVWDIKEVLGNQELAEELLEELVKCILDVAADVADEMPSGILSDWID